MATQRSRSIAHSARRAVRSSRRRAAPAGHSPAQPGPRTGTAEALPRQGLHTRDSADPRRRRAPRGRVRPGSLPREEPTHTTPTSTYPSISPSAAVTYVTFVVDARAWVPAVSRGAIRQPASIWAAMPRPPGVSGRLSPEGPVVPASQSGPGAAHTATSTDMHPHARTRSPEQAPTVHSVHGVHGVLPDDVPQARRRATAPSGAAGRYFVVTCRHASAAGRGPKLPPDLRRYRADARTRTGTPCLQGESGLSSGVHDVLHVLAAVHPGQPIPSDSGAFVTTV